MSTIDFNVREGNPLSHSIFTDNVKLEKKVDIELIKQMIQCVLDYRFSEIVKRSIDEFDGRLNFACPYCGDSAKDIFRKRGNLYFKNMAYKCFNCGVYGNLYNFMNDYKEFCNFDDRDLFILRNYKGTVYQQNKRTLDFFNKEKIKEFSFSRDFIKEKFGFTEISECSKGSYYLRKRHQRDDGQFLYNPKYSSLVILNCDYENNIIGFQTRSLSKNSKQRFFTYTLSKIYDELGMNFPKEAEGLDGISNIFNILRIDYTQNITVFEGPFDSFLYFNSLALSGATKNLPFEVENIHYWYDNDITGIKRSIKYLKEGHYVFLWKKYLKDMNIIELNPPKDLNDLVIYGIEKNIQLLPFADYFSNKKLDMYYI